MVLRLVFAASRVFPGCSDIELTIHSFGDFLQDGAGVIAKMLPMALLRQHGIGALKPRGSKTEGRSYLSNGCAHCDALQGRFFEHGLAYEAEKAFEIGATFESDWGPLMEDAESDIYRWWFDEAENSLNRPQSGE